MTAMNPRRSILGAILVLSVLHAGAIGAAEMPTCNQQCLPMEAVLAVLDYVDFAKLSFWGKPISPAAFNEAKYLDGSFGIKYRFDENEAPIQTIFEEHNIAIESLWMRRASRVVNLLRACLKRGVVP